MKARDLMAPDTDPTDEELELVAKEALNIALAQDKERSKRTGEALKEAAAAAERNRLEPSISGGASK